MDITDWIIRAAIFGVLAAVVIGTFQNIYTAIKKRGGKGGSCWGRAGDSRSREKASMPRPEKRVPTLTGGDEWLKGLFLWKKPRADQRRPLAEARDFFTRPRQLPC